MMKKVYLFIGLALAAMFILTACGKKSKNTVTVLKTATFQGQNDKKISGVATIEGNKILLNNFTEDNSEGEDLELYLSKEGAIKSGKKVGQIKADEESQTFELPAGSKLSDYDALLIWSDKEQQPFAEAKFN